MTLWTVACQAPLSKEFSTQEYWNGLPCPSPGYFPDPGIKPRSPALQADSLLSEHYKTGLHFCVKYMAHIIYFPTVLALDITIVLISQILEIDTQRLRSFSTVTYTSDS